MTAQDHSRNFQASLTSNEFVSYVIAPYFLGPGLSALASYFVPLLRPITSRSQVVAATIQCHPLSPQEAHHLSKAYLKNDEPFLS